jgi:hypothetical protein
MGFEDDGEDEDDDEDENEDEAGVFSRGRGVVRRRVRAGRPGR